MYIYNARDLIIYTIVSILTVVVAFIATNMFAIPKEILVSAEVDQPKKKAKTIRDESVAAPIDGDILSLRQVKDPVFSGGMMGPGIAIKPHQDKVTVYAPQDGKMTVVADTGHAYGLVTKSGNELLIHIGVDTVSLKGKGFTTAVKVGQVVKQGERLGSFETDVISSAGLSSDLLVIMTNSDPEQIDWLSAPKVHHGDTLAVVQKAQSTSETSVVASKS